MKTHGSTIAGLAKDISSGPNPFVKASRRGSHWVWNSYLRRAIKEQSIVIHTDWVDI